MRFLNSHSKFPELDVKKMLQATEMLLFNERMTAQQALERGFVSKVFSKAEFAQKSAELVEKYCKLPKHVSYRIQS